MVNSPDSIMRELVTFYSDLYQSRQEYSIKAPGDDGPPIEVYKQYGTVILPPLLKVFNAAREQR